MTSTPAADGASTPAADGASTPAADGASTQGAGDAARLFVAAWLPDDAVDAIAALPRPDEPGVRWVPEGTWHVTLRFLGTASIAAAVAALDRLDHPPVTATLGPAVHRLGRSVVCLPVAGLDGLAAAVVAATAAVGQPPDPRPFAGHVTLARLRRRAACGVAGQPLAATFEVGEVALVRSTTTHEGPVYETVHRVVLGRGDA